MMPRWPSRVSLRTLARKRSCSRACHTECMSGKKNASLVGMKMHSSRRPESVCKPCRRPEPCAGKGTITLGSATRTWTKGWPRVTPQCGESTWQRLTLPTVTPLLQPHTPQRCEAGISGLRVRRAAGMCAAASSKPASVFRWKRDGRRPHFRSPSERTRKKGVRKTDPKIGPLESCTSGRCSENGLLFFRHPRSVFLSRHSMPTQSCQRKKGTCTAAEDMHPQCD